MDDLKKVSLYRLKEDVEPADFFRKGKKDDQAELPAEVSQVNLDQPPARAYLWFEEAYSKKKTEKDIPWIGVLNSVKPGDPYKFEARNKFPRGIVFLQVEVANGVVRSFAAAFGLGAQNLINPEQITYDFGIKVAMNICDPDKLRRIQTAAHEAVSRQTEKQASVGTALSVFGINSDTELLKMLSGTAASKYTNKIEAFTGRESINLSLKRGEIDDVPKLAELCKNLEERYNSDDYKATDLKAYDRIKLVKDPMERDDLDKVLSAKIEAKDLDTIHLAPPVFLEGENHQFAYRLPDDDQPKELFSDLNINRLLEVPHRRLKDLTAQRIKAWSIFRYDEEGDKLFKAWNAYKCLVAEISHNGDTYVLSGGEWRKISQEIKDFVVQYLAENEVLGEVAGLPEDINIYSPDYDQFREEVYNLAAAANDRFYYFDKSKIEIAGERRYEVCDLLSDEREIIHVKRHSSGAASVGHIFSQAKFYAHAFSSDKRTREGMRNWVDGNDEACNETKDGETFKALIPSDDQDVDEKSFCVVFCVISDRNLTEISELPFMTQYEFVMAHRFLTHDKKFRSFVTFRKIEMTKP